MRTAAFLLLSVAVQTQTPVRDTPAAGQVAGTAVIAGQLMSDENPARPVRLAKVLLSGAAIGREMMITTDASGQFAFRRLPAGRYSLSASKASFMNASYGAKRPGGAGVPIVVADGEQVTVTMNIARGAVISGTVRDANGEPAAGVRVAAFIYSVDSNGARILSSQTFSNSGNGLLMTDDRGAYRIYGLRPGEYYIQAVPGFGSGGGRASSPGEIEWAQRAIATPGSSLNSPPAPGQSMTMAPVYYPGTPDPAGGLPVTVKAGEERSGIDIAIAFTPTATVSGVIRGPDGSAPKLSQGTLVRQNSLVGPGGGGGGNLFIRPDAEGRFTASGVTPGEYVLAARGSMDSAPQSVSGPMALAAMPLWAMTTVTVSGEDISGLELTLAAGLSVTGRLVFEGTTPPPAADMARVRIALMPQGSTSMGAPEVVAKPDGTFAIADVGPGDYKLFVSFASSTGAASSWATKSAIVGGADALDVPFTVRNDVGGAVVTFTDKPTELTGSLLDTAGKPALEYFIVVFPVDRSLWTPQSRRVRSARPGNTGSFRIASLPPGEYYVCAMTDLEQNLLNTAAYLEPLIGASIKLTLAEGEKKVQDLKIAR